MLEKALKSVETSPYTKIAFAIGADAAISEVLKIMTADTSTEVKIARMEWLRDFVEKAGSEASKEIDIIQAFEASAEEGATIQ
jgi:hypothetical protein